ncbi:MAG: peptidyl-prolyl cis-trans isomerase [Saprospiraceae bacterium]
MLKFSSIIFILTICFLASCTPVEETTEENDVELAKVFSKKLFLSELEGMVPEGATPEDSTKIINAEVERWTRETLLMLEAEKNIPADLNIDGLVRDYRMSLIRHNYEQFLVETQLDSVISDQEISTYYEKNKEQYQLQSSILRCFLIKVPKSAPNLDQLRSWWRSTNNEDFQKMKDYATQNASFYMLEEDTWYQQSDLKTQLPQGTNLNPNQDLNQSDENHFYFLKVFEKKSRNGLAPLGYIEDQIKKVILHKRKMVLLDQRKEELYDRETSKKNVKIFTK